MIIPKKMKAAVLYGKKDLRVVERDVPKPDEDEILVKVKACAICGGDPKIIANGWPWGPPMGEYIPGHEYSGEVVSVGERVSDFKIGDRVAAESHKGCGHCINCIRGLYTTCLNYGKTEEGHKQYGFTVNGAYAEYTVSHRNCLHKFSEKISYDEAALLTAGGAALYGIQRIGWIWPGETVAVIGPGPIGLMACQLAKISGAGKIIIIGTRNSRLKVAKKMGIGITINAKEEDTYNIINEQTKGIMADVVIEASGTASGAMQSIELVKKSGRICFLGLYPEPVKIDLLKVVMNNIQVAGGRGEGSHVIERIIPLMEDKRIVVKDLITHKYPLIEINKAFNTFINRIDGAIKVIINP